MKRILFSVVASMVVIFAHADEGTNTLWNFAKELQRAEKDSPPPIKLTATLKSQGRKQFLVFHLVNVSKKSLRLYPYELPWGNPYSLHLAAVNTDGVPLQNIYPIADPGPESEIVVEPGASRDGEYALHTALDFERPRKKKTLWCFGRTESHTATVTTNRLAQESWSSRARNEGPPIVRSSHFTNKE